MIIANILVLVTLAACLGHFLAIHGSSGKVIDIAQQSLQPTLLTELLSPLLALAAPALQHFPGPQSRLARTAQVWHARARASARALQQAAATQPIVMSDGTYMVRWRFLDAQGSPVDVDAAQREAQRWLSGVSAASVQRVSRPSQVQFEWVIRTAEVQTPGFSG